MHFTKYRNPEKVVNVEKRKNGNNLVDNKKLKQMVKDYQLACKEANARGEEDPIIPDDIGRAFLTIARSLSQRYNFYNYSWKDEMISDAVIKCITAVKKFDTEAGTSCFSYFVQVCWFEFISRIKAEAKQKIIKASIVQSLGNEILEVETQEQDSDEEFKTAMQGFSELMNVEIPKAERKKREKKTKEIQHEFF